MSFPFPTLYLLPPPDILIRLFIVGVSCSVFLVKTNRVWKPFPDDPPRSSVECNSWWMKTICGSIVELGTWRMKICLNFDKTVDGRWRLFPVPSISNNITVVVTTRHRSYYDVIKSDIALAQRMYSKIRNFQLKHELHAAFFRRNLMTFHWLCRQIWIKTKLSFTILFSFNVVFKNEILLLKDFKYA